jgi:anti-anti-sigma factor
MSEERRSGEETRVGMVGESAFPIVQRDNAAVIEVTGDLDITNAGQLEAALERALVTDPQQIVVSLARATYFNSIGVHSLLRLAERLKTTRRRLVIVAPAGTTSRRVLEIAGMAAAYPLFDSVEDAIASLTR